MKKVIFTIIMILTMLTSINVYADDRIVYLVGENKYYIEKFTLRIYQVDVYDENKLDNYSVTKYQNNQFDREIEIPNVTVDPRGYQHTISEIDMNFISLNTNITEDMLRGLLSTEIASATATNQYIVEVVVHYQLEETPDKYTKFYYLNSYKEYLKDFYTEFYGTNMPEDLEFVSNYNEIQKTDKIAQPINLVSVANDEFKYYTTAESTTPVLSLYNPLVFAETEAEKDHPKKETIFTNISDLQYFANQIKGMYESPEEPEEPAQPEQPEQPTVPENPHTSVNIPDTALDKSHIIIIAGIVMIIAGLGATYIVFRKTN